MVATCDMTVVGKRCDVIAEGRCLECESAYCEWHRGLRPGQCAACQAGARAEESASDEARAKLKIDALAAISDPSERLVRAMASVYSCRGRTVWPEGGADKILSAARPDLWPDPMFGDHHQQRWDSAEIARWFAKSAIERGIATNAKPEISVEKPGLFGRKLVRHVVPAWRIIDQRSRFPAPSLESATYGSVLIFEDGSMKGNAPSLLREHLMSMPELLGFPPL